MRKQRQEDTWQRQFHGWNMKISKRGIPLTWKRPLLLDGCNAYSLEDTRICGLNGKV